MSISRTEAGAVSSSHQSQFDPATGEAKSHPGKQWLSLSVLLVGNFVTVLDLFIVNVALDKMRGGLHATAAEVQLFIVGYSVPYGVMLLNGARLGDLYGRRRLFLIGMTVFTIASALCGFAQSPAMLIGARALQGLGAALLMPQVFTSLRILFDGEQRRRAFGIMGAVQGVAACISQLAGGVLIDYGVAGLGWRLVFLINVPIGIAALIAGRFLIVETRAPGAARLDLRGAVIAAIGLALLLLPFMEGQDYGWPWWSLALPALSIPVFAYFAYYERRLSAAGGVPIIDVSLFRNIRFVYGVAGIFLFYSAISSFFLSLTMLLQPGLGLSPLWAGAVFTPSAVTFFAAALISPKLAAAIGHRALLTGVAIFGLSLLVAIATGAFAPANLSLLIIALMLNGAGQGLVIPLALNTVLGGVRDDQAGMGSGIVSTLQVMGTSFGVAIVGVLFFSFAPQLADPATRASAADAGHALSMATIYNLAAVIASFAGFYLLTRSTDAQHRRQT
ncbi:MFS transporter [Pseudaminobacter salicylatoxidans]|uniref:MFS transporter n=1 Tax=Pseudaminobacter salicylatoxidans TaxID=93369 RepID=UPI0003017DB3|nr:MFS transporter [Pseudaminobacter salicylatoxidans]